MFSKIVNPETGRLVSINNKFGKLILKKYVLIAGSSKKKGRKKALKKKKKEENQPK